MLWASPAFSQSKTLDRSEDFIVFTGADVPSLVGSDAGGLSLYRWTKEGFKAVPFQVDKRDMEGRYVFPNERVRDPLRDGQALDNNDELVFMVRDAGRMCPAGAWLEGAAKGVEIGLLDPLDESRAWVYLFDVPGSGPPETRDYVDYRVEGGEELVIAKNYLYAKPQNTTESSMLRLRRPDGEFGENLIQGCMLGMRALLLNGQIPIRLQEKEIKAWTQGVIDGPVRVIRYEVKLVKLRVIGFEMASESYVVNYFNANNSPMDVNLPLSLNRMFLNVDMYWYYTFTEAVTGSRFISAANLEGVPLDGKPDQGVDEETDTAYTVLTGPQGSMIDIIFLGDLEGYSIARTTLVRDDLEQEDPAKFIQGNIIGGFWFKNTGRLQKGNYKLLFYHYYPHPFSMDKVSEIENMVLHPVELDTRAMEPPPSL